MKQADIANWCASGALPEGDGLYSSLLKEDGLFDDAEGIQWDFKEAWPFSQSDEYFGGIARLICAFANTQGGIIVFGVHDKKRTGGHNSVKLNIDRFNLALRQLLDSLPVMSVKSYINEQAGGVDVLLVKPRPHGVPPYRFNKTIGKYKAGIIWARVGHEVRAADPSHYPALFCRARAADFGETAPLGGSIPPSPATLKQRFVGRTEVLDRLFHWLEASDEPRTFLHGKGGSGKTTIAYEFARLVKDNGENLRSFGDERLDAVIFVSAKEKSLLVAEAKIVETESRDFSNERELLYSILYYGGWTRDEQYLEGASVDQLRADIRDYFNFHAVLLVIDDVDTLTTKGVDPGSDFLYRTLCRAERNSKVVYTLRNAPSQSLFNAVEVPGLNDEDYGQFIEECIEHFKVPPPTAEFQAKKLSEISERRPLVIESVVALRRTAGSYEQAVELFQQQTGDAIRDYVFLREWDALSSNVPRLLLAALSEFNESASFSDLQSVLQYEPSIVRDGIGAVREMFLQIDEAGSDALYALAPLTKAFVKSKRSQLVGYGLLRERVKAFHRHVAVSNPRVANIATQVERLLPNRYQNHQSDRVNDAYKIVSDKNLPPYVTEDPFFRTVLGYVCSCSIMTRLPQARAAFKYAFDMKFEPEYHYLRAWFNAEKGSGVNDGWCISISDFVLQGKRYEERDKMEMIGRKATSLYARAQERLITDPSDALKDLTEALRLHLRAYRLYCIAGDIRAENSDRYARGTAFQLFNTLAKSLVPWEFVEILETLARSGDGYIDPLEDPIAEAIDYALRSSLKADTISRIRQRARSATEALAHDAQWLSPAVKERVLIRVRRFEKELEDKGKALRQMATSNSR